MNLKRAKQKWNVAKMLSTAGTFFWISETVYFLISYGWHYRAINQYERICDNIVWSFWGISFILTGSVIIDMIEYLFGSSTKNNI